MKNYCLKSIKLLSTEQGRSEGALTCFFHLLGVAIAASGTTLNKLPRKQSRSIKY